MKIKFEMYPLDEKPKKAVTKRLWMCKRCGHVKATEVSESPTQYCQSINHSGINSS